MRKRLYQLYWKLERIIHPGLKYSQYHYCDALDALVPMQSDWLDLGCGHQMFAPWMNEEAARLAARARHLVGIDMDFPALKINPVMHGAVFGDISSLPFAAATFDVVTANMVVEHLDKPKAVLEEAHRILRPGGLFIFHTPNRKSVAITLVRMMPQFLKNWLALVLEQREEKDVFPTHYAMNTQQAVSEYAGSAGFRVREIRTVSTSAITALTPFCVIELLYLRLLERPGLAGLRSNLIVALEKPHFGRLTNPKPRIVRLFAVSSIPVSDFYIVVPVLNEAPNLERLLAAFHDLVADFGTNHNLHFLMVDDGSTDGTAEQTKEMAGSLNLQVLAHDRNYGPGRAFATAFEYLAPRIQDDDWVATMEGDNTSRHELLRQMFMRTAEGYEVILASPYSYGGGIRNTAGVRVFLSHFANAFLKGCVGIHGIFTMSSFFRLFRGSALKRLQGCYGPGIMERTGFEAVVEMLIKMILLKMTISEVPMLLDTARRAGKSKMKVVKTIRSYLTLFLDRGRWVRQASLFIGQPVEGLDEVVTTK